MNIKNEALIAGIEKCVNDAKETLKGDVIDELEQVTYIEGKLDAYEDCLDIIRGYLEENP